MKLVIKYEENSVELDSNVPDYVIKGGKTLLIPQYIPTKKTNNNLMPTNNK
jgi:hypothetical protein